MDKGILNPATKYQKSWPLPKCKHELAQQNPKEIGRSSEAKAEQNCLNGNERKYPIGNRRHSIECHRRAKQIDSDRRLSKFGGRNEGYKTHYVKKGENSNSHKKRILGSGVHLREDVSFESFPHLWRNFGDEQLTRPDQYRHVEDQTEIMGSRQTVFLPAPPQCQHQVSTAAQTSPSRDNQSLLTAQNSPTVEDVTSPHRQTDRHNRTDKDKAEGTTIIRTYQTRNNYGTLYELKRISKDKFTVTSCKDEWLWQRDYKLWKKHFKRHIINDDSSDESEDTKPRDKPHPDLYGAFNSRNLHRQLENNGAMEIQRMVRGWLVRRRLANLKEKAIDLGIQWADGMKEYLQVRTKVRERLHVLRNEQEVDLHDVRAFLEQKKEYEDVFKRLTNYRHGGLLPREELMEFFNACGLNPSEREIGEAFRAVFGGSSEVEVMLLVDRSEESGPLGLKSYLGVVKDLVSSLGQLTAVTRLAVLPFDDAVSDICRLQEGGVEETLSLLDEIKFRGGQRQSHMVLRELRNMFKSSSPGASKIAIAVTGGPSTNPEDTLSEASQIRKENINLFSIGVGQRGHQQDISLPGNSYHVSGPGAWKRMSQDALGEIISKSKFSNQSRETRYREDVSRPLGKEEVMALLWTIYPPHGITARQHRRSTWLHPIVDGEEASPALEEEMKRQTDLITCVRVVVQARLMRDGFIVLPTDGPMGAERVHDLETAMAKFESYLHSGKCSDILQSSI